MAKILLKDAKIKDGACIECGAGGMARGLDPACETCSTPDVNSIQHGGFEFDVFITDSGNLGFTVYEHGKGRDDDEARCLDIIVRRDLKEPILVS